MQSVVSECSRSAPQINVIKASSFLARNIRIDFGDAIYAP
jgi:hypothetical protein